MEATELNHGTAFQWKAWSTYRFSPHCVCIFLLYFLPTWTFLSFSFLSTTPYIGKFVYYVSGEGSALDGWNAQDGWYPKRNIVLY